MSFDKNFDLTAEVQKMITMENSPVDPDNIQGSHRRISFMKIKFKNYNARQL